jgi:hypothetical protein
MSFFHRVAAILAAACLLAGCAQQEIPFDRSTGSVKTIGLLTPSLPTGPSVVLASSVGQSFGLVGALVDAGMQTSRESHFRNILSTQHFTMTDTFTADLTKALASKGYKVVPVQVSREKADFLTHYPNAASLPGANGMSGGPDVVDAYLDVVVMDYGYVAAGIGSGSPYRPETQMKIKLVRAKDGTVLMQDNIAYNPVNKQDRWVTLSADPKHAFQNFDALEANPQLAVEGLSTAIAQSTGAVGTLLQ